MTVDLYNKIAIPIALIWFVAYLVVILIKFGFIKSISKSFYEWEKVKEGAGTIFTLTLCGIAALVFPAMIEAMPENLQFLGFFAPALLMFVGCAPKFMSGKLEESVHMGNAIVSGTLCVLWTAIYFFTLGFSITGILLFFLVFAAIIFLIAYITKSIKSSYILWIECWAFGSLAIGLFTYWLQLL